MIVETLPRVGFAGVGWIGRQRMHALRDSGSVEVALLCDPLADLSGEQGRTAGSFEELLASDVEAIVIATPTALHAEQAIAALERGKAVFCQKPLGRNAAETRRVVDAARAADLLLGVDLSYRHTAAMRAVSAVIERGEVGELFAADLVFHNAYGPDKPWFYDRRLAGGGCLLDLGIHLADLLLTTLPSPVAAVTSRLFAGGRATFDRAAAVEDYATARIDFAGGATANLACSWRLSAGRDCVIEVRFYGTGGAPGFRNIGGSFYDFVAERYDGNRCSVLAAPPDDWGGRAAVRWGEQLRAGGRFDPEVERIVEVAALLDAIYAADGGR
ncbi:MAG: oxidoreductase [Acidobacteria bacterium]|nr:oxidoreductase [Acidobacteriota bacterium]